MANRKQFDITKSVSSYTNNDGQEKTVWGNLGRLTLYSETSDIPEDIKIFCELHVVPSFFLFLTLVTKKIPTSEKVGTLKPIRAYYDSR